MSGQNSTSTPPGQLQGALTMPDLHHAHGLNPAHSEVVAACELMEPRQALDMGCGSGRHALYLAQEGFDVTAVDHNPHALASLEALLPQEGLNQVTPSRYDINDAS